MGFFDSFMGGLSKVTEIVGLVNQGVQIVEAVTAPLKAGGTPVSSQGKQAMAKAFVQTAIQGSELFLGKDIIDEAAFDAALNQIIDGVVAAMNAVKA